MANTGKPCFTSRFVLDVLNIQSLVFRHSFLTRVAHAKNKGYFRTRLLTTKLNTCIMAVLGKVYIT